MDLVCDSNMFLESTLGVTFLYLLKHIFHPSFPPSISSSVSMACQHGWHPQLTHLPPARHPPATGKHKALNPHTSTSISRSRRLPPHANQPAALVLTTLQQGKVLHSLRCLILSIPSTFLPPYSSRLHSMIQPTRNTGQLCHLSHACQSTEVTTNLVIFRT